MEIVHTCRNLKSPKQIAEAFRLQLATERGYTSTITKIANGYRVVASDGRGVEFLSVKQRGAIRRPSLCLVG